MHGTRADLNFSRIDSNFLIHKFGKGSESLLTSAIVFVGPSVVAHQSIKLPNFAYRISSAKRAKSYLHRLASPILGLLERTPRSTASIPKRSLAQKSLVANYCSPRCTPNHQANWTQAIGHRSKSSRYGPRRCATSGFQSRVKGPSSKS